MTPYYDCDGITIYHADCQDVLPSIGHVPIVLTDPPYGLGNKWVGGGGSQHTSWRFNPDEARNWDGATVDIVSSLPSIAKHCIIWGGNYYSLPPSRCWFVWDKKMNDAWTTGQAELAWTSIDAPVRIYRMAQCEAHSEMSPKVHPTQKPLSLMTWCLKFVPDTEGLILDPFMGSGTTLVAAKLANISAIGIELDERYCELAAKRLEQRVFNFAG